jgi:hypothetical protein
MIWQLCSMTTLLAAVSGLAQQPATGELGRDLVRVARVASVMVDGDTCRRIQTKRSQEYMLREDPRDKWAASDNYDVQHEPFIQTKKTLMRLARLCLQPCDVNLWMPVAGEASQVQIVIRTTNEMSQFWRWGALSQEMPPEMRAVFTKGERVSVTVRPGMLSLLAPVSDSLGDIVGLVEVVSQAQPDPRDNVK